MGGCLFEAHLGSGLLHADAEFLGEIAVTAFEEQARVANGLGIFLLSDKTFDAGSQAAMDVVLEARLRVETREIHLAGRNQKIPVDEMNQPVGEVGREVGAVIGGPILSQAASDEDFGMSVLGELDIGITLIVAKEDIETGLVLLDQVVLKSERLLFVFDEDVIDILGFGDEGTGFGVSEVIDREVAADAVAEDLGLAHVDDAGVAVLIKIDTGRERELRDLLKQVGRHL
jgi:hypothetical protein